MAKLKELFWKETFKLWGKSQTVNSMFYGKGRFRNINYGSFDIFHISNK